MLTIATCRHATVAEAGIILSLVAIVTAFVAHITWIPV